MKGVEVAEGNEVHQQPVQVVMVEDEALHVRERFEVARRVFVLLRQRLETGREVAGEQFSKPFHAEFFHAVFGLRATSSAYGAKRVLMVCHLSEVSSSRTPRRGTAIVTFRAMI